MDVKDYVMTLISLSYSAIMSPMISSFVLSLRRTQRSFASGILRPQKESLVQTSAVTSSSYVHCLVGILVKNRLDSCLRLL